MSYRDHLPAIIQGNKKAMRESALMWRKARARGDVQFMITWLSHACQFRKLIQDYQEFQ